MSTIEVRRFRRDDRQQVTRLVNIHACAVIPGMATSVNAVMSQLEREPGEFIVDAWVVERATLVAEQRGRIVAASHVLRYANAECVSDCYRNAGELRWFLFWPPAPYWPDSRQAADALMRACLEQLERWGVTTQLADGALPLPGVYGVPEQWPHIRSMYVSHGFVHEGHVELVSMANVREIPRSEPPIAGMRIRRSVGINGTRLTAMLGDDELGYVEVESREDPGRQPLHGGLADIGNLHVVEAYRRKRVGTYLIGQAADWLDLARLDRVLDYAWPEEHVYDAFLRAVGFQLLTRTERGWRRTPNSTVQAMALTASVER